MGSPLTETERTTGDEALKRIVIPRSFAIATTEVTKDQFQRFLKLGKIKGDGYQDVVDLFGKFKPDPKGAGFGSDWHTAAHYCNWLSEQEGVPEKQWCYGGGEDFIRNVMVNDPESLDRVGYRLLTEPEWEFACRAGAATSRYYGNSVGLLDAYAWYQGNSKDRARDCGSLLPNDLGLFDMLGNEIEWVDDIWAFETPRKDIYPNKYRDVLLNGGFPIDEGRRRPLRGGAFDYLPASVRSAYCNWNAPATRTNDYGFRLARTLR
jgi:formylglycine-generating enzyme required for sulfatase activity